MESKFIRIEFFDTKFLRSESFLRKRCPGIFNFTLFENKIELKGLVLNSSYDKQTLNDFLDIILDDDEINLSTNIVSMFSKYASRASALNKMVDFLFLAFLFECDNLVINLEQQVLSEIKKCSHSFSVVGSEPYVRKVTFLKLLDICPKLRWKIATQHLIDYLTTFYAESFIESDLKTFSNDILVKLLVNSKTRCGECKNVLVEKEIAAKTITNMLHFMDPRTILSIGVSFFLGIMFCTFMKNK